MINNIVLRRETLVKVQEIFIKDLTKPTINVLDRAKMLNQYIKDHNLTHKQFSDVFNFSKTTIHEWLLPLKLSKKQQDLITEETLLADVYTMLGKDRLKKKKTPVEKFIKESKVNKKVFEEIEESVEESQEDDEDKNYLENDLDRTIVTFKKYIGNGEVTIKVNEKIILLKNILNKILEN